MSRAAGKVGVFLPAILGVDDGGSSAARYGQNECAIVVGRKNCLFRDTVAGAHASARLYTLIETAKVNGLDPYANLRQVFTELPKAQSLAEIEALLPTRIRLGDLARDSLQAAFPTTRQSRRLRGAYRANVDIVLHWETHDLGPLAGSMRATDVCL